MGKYLYCKYCGKVYGSFVSIFDDDSCAACKNDDALVYSLKEEEYYDNKAEELYNDILRYKKVLFDEEISKNPDFDPELKKRIEREAEFKHNLQIINRNRSNSNTPKCPTCGSTNIGKISATSKVAGAAMFGLFSRTAKSQFRCNSCGYKW